jgi:hypothetical protein
MSAVQDATGEDKSAVTRLPPALPRVSLRAEAVTASAETVFSATAAACLLHPGESV